MAREPRSIEELLRIVGGERDAHSPDEVAEAEAELKERLGASEELFSKRLRRAGSITAALGLLTGIMPLWATLMFVAQVGSPPMPLPNDWRGLAGLAATCAAFALQTVIGFVLFFSGLAFRRRKEWARKTILAIIWIAIAYCLGSVVVWEIAIPITMGLSGETIGFMIIGPAVTAIWLLILWVPKRYFSSPRVRQACDPSLRQESDEGCKMSHRS